MGKRYTSCGIHSYPHPVERCAYCEAHHAEMRASVPVVRPGESPMAAAKRLVRDGIDVREAAKLVGIDAPSVRYSIKTYGNYTPEEQAVRMAAARARGRETQRRMRAGIDASNTLSVARKRSWKRDDEAARV